MSIVEKREGDLLRVASAKDEGNHPLGNLATFVGQGIEVDQGQLSCFGLLFHVGSGIFAQNAFQGVAGHDGQSGVARRRLLAGLHDHTNRFQFDEGVMGLILSHRHIDHHAGGFFTVHEMLLVYFPAQLDKTAFVAKHLGIGQGQRRKCSRIHAIRVIPDHEAVIVDLLGDQADEMFCYDAEAHFRVRFLFLVFTCSTAQRSSALGHGNGTILSTGFLHVPARAGRRRDQSYFPS